MEFQTIAFYRWRRFADLVRTAARGRAGAAKIVVVLAAASGRLAMVRRFSQWKLATLEISACRRIVVTHLAGCYKTKLRGAWERLQAHTELARMRSSRRTLVLQAAALLLARIRRAVTLRAFLRWQDRTLARAKWVLQQRIACFILSQCMRRSVLQRVRRAFSVWAMGMLRTDAVDIEHAASLWALRRIAGASWRRWRLRRLARAWAAWTRFSWCWDVEREKEARSEDRMLLQRAHESDISNLWARHRMLLLHQLLLSR